MGRSKKYLLQVEEYNNNPNLCLLCGKPILCENNQTLSAIKKKKFCNRSCAISYNNRDIVRNHKGNINNLILGFKHESHIDNYSDEDIIKIYNTSNNISEFSRKLGYARNISERQKKVCSRLQSIGIDVNLLKHESNRNNDANVKYCKKCNNKISNDNKSGLCQACYIEQKNQEKLLRWKETGDTSCQIGSHIRNCIRDYIYEKQHFMCAICGISNEWNGKELKFVLDHIDGDASNNGENNLRLICPNCDSQLDTYKSKNKNSARNNRIKYYSHV